MSIFIIIDGYNLIRKYSPLSRAERGDFSKGREKLLEWLWEYRKKVPNPITVVFDGTKGGEPEEGRDIYKGIKVRYSSLGHTADEVIKRLVSQDGEKYLVVTSDRELGSYCQFRKAGWIRSEDFAQKVEEKLWKEEKEELEEAEDLGVSAHKKKGSAFRLSKKAKKEKKYLEYL
jgi:predicted RNA-binding protein with PIN domain